MVGGDVKSMELLPVVPARSESQQIEIIGKAFETFNASNCNCRDDKDKERMLVVVQTAFGSMRAFNDYVTCLLDRVKSRSQFWSVLASSVRSESDFSSSVSDSDVFTSS